MKKMIMAACATLIAMPALATERSYTAQEQEDGKFCARVQIQTVGLAHVTRTKCRTLAEWEEAGYIVTLPETAQTEKEGNEQLAASQS